MFIPISMPCHGALNSRLFHKEQCDAAGKQYASQDQETIPKGKQKRLSFDRPAYRTDGTSVRRVRIATLRHEVRCRLLQALLHGAGVNRHRLSDAFRMETLSDGKQRGQPGDPDRSADIAHHVEERRCSAALSSFGHTGRGNSGERSHDERLTHSANDERDIKLWVNL